MNNLIDFAVADDGIATLTIDVADHSMNVITPRLVDALAAAVEQAAADDRVSGVIICSAKDSFVAGADLKDLLAMLDGDMSLQRAYGVSQRLSTVLRRLETCGKPFVAAVNGTALGGGFEIALACHHRIAADAPGWVAGLPEVKVGLMPGAGGTQRLPRMIGIEAALPLMLKGRHLRPGDAQQAGLVDEVVPAGELLARARRWLCEEAVAEQPWDRKDFRFPGGAGAVQPKTFEAFMVGTALVAAETLHNYPAPVAILSSVYEGSLLPMDSALRIESQYFAELLAGPVARNMVRTLFVNKGIVEKGLRRPAGVADASVQKVGVLGAGLMGSGIADVAATAGIDVVLLDITMERAAAGKAHVERELGKQMDRGRLAAEGVRAALDRVQATNDFVALEGVDLVVEAVPEDRTLKAEVTARAEAVIGAPAIFASNTSTLPISGLAECSQRPESFLGLHFFSPVEKMPLVEIIVGERTSQAALARGFDFARQLGKTPIVVKDSRGFFTSRVFTTFTNEGWTMLEEGVNPALIENGARLAGMPVGPLAVSDEVNMELALQVMRQTQADMGKDWAPPAGYGVVRRFVEELERPGKRQGKGFYEYRDDGGKRLWPGIAEIYPRARQQPPVEEVTQRLLCIQALETARCVEEGIISPMEADIGSIFGIGFPPWTGGTVSYIDTLGIREFVATCDRLADVHGSRFAVSDWLRKRAEHGQQFYDK